MSRSALLLGGSGLIGGHCLDLLLADQAYSRVVILVRKPLSRAHPKLQQSVADFDHLDRVAALLRVNDVFCCLGTTIKKAGSQEAFRQVDFEYPVALAKLAAQNGAAQFLLVTALGANPRSSIFYNRVKGEVEAAIQSLPFRAIHIFRPSLLVGRRAEIRLGEKIGEKVMQWFSFLFIAAWRKYRPIPARAVAVAMVNRAKEDRTGVHIHESDTMQESA